MEKPGSALEQKVKAMIVETLQLEDIVADDIDSDLPLFGDGLGLDSIDALELGLALEARYGVALPQASGELHGHLVSVRILVSLIEAERRGGPHAGPGSVAR